ncbi:MAG TPA: SRPBCC domain-containing protein [Acidimicrobiales bacterium]|nr:SRPBCC domain-containing protein [Acidimicrobiales bacterium]
MIRRQVVVPAPPGTVWEFLTSADQAGPWLGGDLTWTPEEGGDLRFTGTDGAVRHGVVEVVRPARYLRYRWWPAEPGTGPASEVAYLLEPEADHTRLTVQEAMVEGPGPDGAPSDGHEVEREADATVGENGGRAATELPGGATSLSVAGPVAASMSAAAAVAASLSAAAALSAMVPVSVEGSLSAAASWGVGDDIRFRLWAGEHQLTSVG